MKMAPTWLPGWTSKQLRPPQLSPRFATASRMTPQPAAVSAVGHAAHLAQPDEDGRHAQMDAKAIGQKRGG